jgi:hypothetical protein
MALGNIKVDRTAVIGKIEDAIKVNEKAVKDGEKAQAGLEATHEKATAEVVKLGKAALTSGTPTVDVRSWHNRVTVNVELSEADGAPVVAAQRAAQEAWEAVNHNKRVVQQAKGDLADAKRDLSLLNASSEVTINVKTAGFLGYFS